jgi:hypothetical protein
VAFTYYPFDLESDGLARAEEYSLHQYNSPPKSDEQQNPQEEHFVDAAVRRISRHLPEISA